MAPETKKRKIDEDVDLWMSVEVHLSERFDVYPIELQKPSKQDFETRLRATEKATYGKLSSAAPTLRSRKTAPSCPSTTATRHRRTVIFTKTVDRQIWQLSLHSPTTGIWNQKASIAMKARETRRNTHTEVKQEDDEGNHDIYLHEAMFAHRKYHEPSFLALPSHIVDDAELSACIHCPYRYPYHWPKNGMDAMCYTCTQQLVKEYGQIGWGFDDRGALALLTKQKLRVPDQYAAHEAAKYDVTSSRKIEAEEFLAVYVQVREIQS
ncbi:hypothetical protein CC86DRAFT_85880 [Ophiobolus disseminans]|uniref:Uncharacterized protein n=1 Tax=Ophiobolus disseminans TaxID=1469910 RepID=A0A6A7AHD7_9PLEO|nr:hypothetical protein CC86DRAFT_85880 [Ophiobolus disseminans]